jgi:hypothetical protein
MLDAASARWLASAACCSLALLTAGCMTDETAPTYRERIALPAGAVFEAILEDVSRADARPRC